MIKVLMERDLPANFDVTDDTQAAWHARIALDAVIATNGKMHWLCTYATDDRKLFGLVVVENEQVIDDFVRQVSVAISGFTGCSVFSIRRLPRRRFSRAEPSFE